MANKHDQLTCRVMPCVNDDDALLVRRQRAALARCAVSRRREKSPEFLRTAAGEDGVGVGQHGQTVRVV